MSKIKKCNNLKINSYGTIGSLMNGHLDSYLSVDEIKNINKKIDILNKKLQEFNIFKYKIINRYKIRNLIVKVLSEESDYFIEIAVNLLNMSEDNFEIVIDSFMKLTKKDIDVLYFILWENRENDEFNIKHLKKRIEQNYNFVPDLIVDYELCINNNLFANSENSLIIGDSLTLLPEKEFNIVEKLAYNNFIKLSKYIPNKMDKSFNTYLCFTFTHLGIHLCKIMESIQHTKNGELKNE